MFRPFFGGHLYTWFYFVKIYNLMNRSNNKKILYYIIFTDPVPRQTRT
jgi:hypothetical protein